MKLIIIFSVQHSLYFFRAFISVRQITHSMFTFEVNENCINRVWTRKGRIIFNETESLYGVWIYIFFIFLIIYIWEFFSYLFVHHLYRTNKKKSYCHLLLLAQEQMQLTKTSLLYSWKEDKRNNHCYVIILK